MNFLTLEQVAALLEANELPYWRAFHHNRNATKADPTGDQLIGRARDKAPDLSTGIQELYDWAGTVGTGSYRIVAQPSQQDSANQMTFYLRLLPQGRMGQIGQPAQPVKDPASEALIGRLDRLEQANAAQLAENQKLRDEIARREQEARQKELDARFDALQQQLEQERSVTNKFMMAVERLAAIGAPMLMEYLQKGEPEPHPSLRTPHTPNPNQPDMNPHNIHGFEDAEVLDGETPVSEEQSDRILDRVQQLIHASNADAVELVLTRLAGLPPRTLHRTICLFEKATEKQLDTAASMLGC